MRARVRLAAAVIAGISANLAPAADPVVREDKVVAGGPKDALQVRHLVLKGTNEEIGRALAEITKERFQSEPDRSTDQVRTRAQRRYMEKNYPVLFDRMRGAATAYGKRLEDDTWTFGGLTALPSRPGRPFGRLPAPGRDRQRDRRGQPELRLLHRHHVRDRPAAGAARGHIPAVPDRDVPGPRVPVARHVRLRPAERSAGRDQLGRPDRGPVGR